MTRKNVAVNSKSWKLSLIRWRWSNENKKISKLLTEIITDIVEKEYEVIGCDFCIKDKDACAGDGKCKPNIYKGLIKLLKEKKNATNKDWLP